MFATFPTTVVASIPKEEATPERAAASPGSLIVVLLECCYTVKFLH